MCYLLYWFFFFKQKTAYELRISDLSSDVCSSDLQPAGTGGVWRRGVSAQITDRVLTCYRIGDPDGAHPIYDSEGARLYPGRWNTAASPIIYTSEHYSTAMLEKLVHANTVMPANQHYIRITIPNGVSYEVFPTGKFSGWDGKREEIGRAHV